jgi:hypothetical protein
MGYVLVGLLVVVIVAAGVTALVLSSRRHQRDMPRTSSDADYGGGKPGSDTAIFAQDPDVPLGDTAEHAGEQQDGETVADADEGGGEAGRRPAGGHRAPPVDGGEGEGRRAV